MIMESSNNCFLLKSLLNRKIDIYHLFSVVVNIFYSRFFYFESNHHICGWKVYQYGLYAGRGWFHIQYIGGFSAIIWISGSFSDLNFYMINRFSWSFFLSNILPSSLYFFKIIFAVDWHIFRDRAACAQVKCCSFTNLISYFLSL